MTDGVDLADAVLALLAAPGLTVLDGEVKTTPAGSYVVLYDDAPRRSSRSLAGIAHHSGYTYRVICAGRDAAEVRHVVAGVLTRLSNRRLVADRAASWLVPVPDGAPIIPDRSVPGDVRFSQTLTFRLTTRS